MIREIAKIPVLHSYGHFLPNLQLPKGHDCALYFTREGTEA